MNAIRNGIILAANFGSTRLMIESDSTVVVKAANQPDAYVGPDVSVVAECKQVGSDFASISFVHCCREENVVADSLAKHYFSTSSSSFWDSTMPDFVFLIIVKGMAILPIIVNGMAI